MRPLRCPIPGYIYEITTSTINGEFLLRPSDEVNRIVLGVIGRAQDLTGVRIHGFVFLSTHYHLLISVRNTRQKSAFMRMLNGNLSKKLNHHHQRTGTMWHRRFRAIGVAADRETQESRMRYILAHGVKEGLVARTTDWPGASALPWLLRGDKLVGIWTDFTARYHAQRRVDYVPLPGEFEREYEVHITVLPCWTDLGTATWRRVVVGMTADIEADGVRARAGAPVAGVEVVLAFEPTHRRPRRLRRRCAPIVHAVDSEVRRELRRMLRAIRDAYAEASARFRRGEWQVEFPADTFCPPVGLMAAWEDALAAC